MKRSAIFPCLLLAGACAAPHQASRPLLDPTWRDAATANDRERLREWRAAFVTALASARRAGHGNDIDREGALLHPDVTNGGPSLPAGDYRCRVIKVGAKSSGLLDFIAYPNFRCRVKPSGRLQSFAKLTGSQRYFGRIFPADPMRSVFLGTIALGDERQAMRYGADRERDVAGYVERIGPTRWRLVMPRPHFESQLDVLELVPATPQ